MKTPSTPLLLATLTLAATLAGAQTAGQTNSQGGTVYPDNFVGPLMPNDCYASSCSGPTLGTNVGASSFGMLSTLNSPDGSEWADPKCNYIPCLTKAMKEQMDKEKAAAAQEKNQSRTLPNGDTVTTFPDGKVAYCTGTECSMPMTPEELAAKNARYREALGAEEQDKKMFSGDSGGGMRMASNDGKKSTGEPPAEDAGGSNDGGQLGGGTLEAFNLGNEMGSAGLYASNDGGSGGRSLDGSGSAGGSYGSSGGSAPEITREAGVTGDVELTYERNIENQRRFQGFADEAAALVQMAQDSVAGANADPTNGSARTFTVGSNGKK